MDDCRLEAVLDVTCARDELDEGPADIVGDVDDWPVPDKVEFERSFELEHVEFDDDVDADSVDVEDDIDGDELSWRFFVASISW